MINLIYQDEIDLVLGDPRYKYFKFKNNNEHRKAVDDYIIYVKEFIDKLPEKYKSVSNIYEEIKDCYANPDYCVGLVCLLYINILENEHILNSYYDNGLKKDDKEEFIRYICKKICLEVFDGCERGGPDYLINEIHNKELGFLKIYASIYAIKEYYTNQIISKTCVKSFYEKDYYTNLSNLSRIFLNELTILNIYEIENLKNTIDKNDLGIYELMYLLNFVDNFTNNKDNKIYIDEEQIKNYMKFIKRVDKKQKLFRLSEFKNLNPIILNNILDNGYLNFDEIYSLLMIVRYFLSNDKENASNKIIDTFNNIGIYENYDLCQKFLCKELEPFNKLFDIKFLDILYQIKDRTKEDIELSIKILNTIIEKINAKKIISHRYYYKVYYDIFSSEDDFHYDNDYYTYFLDKAKRFNKNPDSYKKNLGYTNVDDYRKEYLWKVYQYICKINNFILNNEIIKNYSAFMELLDLNDNKIESRLSSKIKDMLANEGYLKTETSYQKQKKL